MIEKLVLSVDLNRGPTDLQLEALTTEPSRHKVVAWVWSHSWVTWHFTTLQYLYFKRHLTPRVTSGASTSTCYTKYSPPAQHTACYTASRVRPNRKISCAAAQFAATQIDSNTHNIISSMAPHEFNVVLRTCMDEFNVIPRTVLCFLLHRGWNNDVLYHATVSNGHAMSCRMDQVYSIVLICYVVRYKNWLAGG